MAKCECGSKAKLSRLGPSPARVCDGKCLVMTRRPGMRGWIEQGQWVYQSRLVISTCCAFSSRRYNNLQLTLGYKWESTCRGLLNSHKERQRKCCQILAHSLVRPLFRTPTQVSHRFLTRFLRDIEPAALLASRMRTYLQSFRSGQIATDICPHKRATGPAFHCSVAMGISLRY